jgi:hypothetical protein
MSGNRTLDARTARARVEALLTARGCDFESDGDAAVVFPGELDDATCSVTLTLDDTTLGDEHATSEALSLTLAAVLPLPPVLALHRDRVDVLIGRAAPWVGYGAFEVDPDLGQVQLRYAWTLPADIGLPDAFLIAPAYEAIGSVQDWLPAFAAILEDDATVDEAWARVQDDA